MNWSKVGEWVKENAGAGAALVGSLLTGNVPGAVAAGVSLVSGATGFDDPDKVLTALKTDPDTLVKLRGLALQNEANIRKHIEEMKKLELQDLEASHHETQETIRSGDNSKDAFVRRTRPGQSWLSLFAAIAYAFMPSPNLYVLGTLMALPLAYAGLRQIGKGIDMVQGAKCLRGK